METKEGMNVAVLFTEELRVLDYGFSLGGSVFPYRFVVRVSSAPRMDECERLDTLFLSGVREVKEMTGVHTYIVFDFVDGTEIMCSKSKIRHWEAEKLSGEI